MTIQDQNQNSDNSQGRPIRSAVQQATIDQNDQVSYEPGDTIEFMLPDDKGAAHWFPGKIHAVKRIEDPITHLILNVTYLADTGRDERLDEVIFNPRLREIDKRVDKLVKAGKKLDDAAIEVAKAKDLPASTTEIEIVRQPQQIELPESAIRKA